MERQRYRLGLHGRVGAQQPAPPDLHPGGIDPRETSSTEDWIDWNVVLDRNGGPNHTGNCCDALIMIDTDTVPSGTRSDATAETQ